MQTIKLLGEEVIPRFASQRAGLASFAYRLTSR
jgi:hypothetical protein